MARPTAPAGRESTVDETEVARTERADTTYAEGLGYRDRVRWGPVIAGVLTTIVTAVILTVLGLAIGLSAFDPGADGIGTAAAIWGIVTMLVAFFVGGFVAAQTAAEPTGLGGPMNGLFVGVTALFAILVMVGTGVANVFGALGVSLGDIAAIGPELAEDVAPGVFGDAEASAWATFFGLVLALAAATVGGLLGNRPETGERGGRTVTRERTRRA